MQEFVDELLLELGQEGIRFVRPKIRSSRNRRIDQLRESLTLRRTSPETIQLYIPEYWAIYVHDGRRTIDRDLRGNGILVFFRNPNDDPRLRNGKYPERLADLRRLTRAEFLRFSALNREAQRQGRQGPMIVTNRVRPVRGTFFFDNGRGMNGFRSRANQIGQDKFRSLVRMQFADLLDVREDIRLRI